MAHSFRSALKIGLAAQSPLRANDSGLPASLTTPIEVAADGANLPRTVVHSFTLLGPGDVVGLDHAEIVRTEPANGVVGFEPNFFPFVEFGSPDLPWRYTPAVPDGQGRLVPWLVLAVLREDEDVALSLRAGGGATLEVKAGCGTRLPRLDEAHLWAHVHDPGPGGGGSVARILCPARLNDGADYLACLVPVFEAGRRAGLGLEPDGTDDATLAWSAKDEACQLPVYFWWRFRTGRDDFEELARRLVPMPADPRLGMKPLDLSATGSGLDAADLGLADLAERGGERILIDYAGAMTAPEPKTVTWPPRHKAAFQDGLATRLRSRPARDTKTRDYDPLRDDPVVGPPNYGSWQTGEATPGTGWPSELNLDPALRLAAGLAARTVRADQESLMADAWHQAEGAREVSRRLRRARLSAAVGGAVHRRVASLPPEVQLQITSPAHGAMKVDANATLEERFARATWTPPGALDPAFRRLARRLSLHAGTEDGGEPLLSIVAKAVASQQVGRAELARIVRSAAKSYEQTVDFMATATGGQGSPTAERLDLSGVRRMGVRQAAAGRLRKAPVVAPAAGAVKAPAVEVAQAAIAAIPAALDPVRLAAERVAARVADAPRRRFAAMPVARSAEVAVRFDQPAYERLAQRAVEALLPGAGALPLNGVALVETNPEFVAGYLVGLNHEMSRELAWRRFPAHLHGTWFCRFWDYAEPRNDIGPIAGWDRAKKLRTCVDAPPAGRAVALTRAELLRRYPDTIVYAAPARWAAGGKRRTVTDADIGKAVAPEFSGRLGDGIAFFGFPMTVDDMAGSRDPDAGKPGWFVAFEEAPFAPRFGLDAANAFSPRTAPATADDLSWGHFAANEAALAQLSLVPARPAWHATPIDGAVWGRSAADVARLTWQRPIRILIHADTLVA